MSRSTEVCAPTPSPRQRPSAAGGPILLFALTLAGSGCSLAPRAVPPPAPAPVAAPAPAPAPSPAPAPAPPPPPRPDPGDLALRQWLAFNDRLRQMAPAELALELARPAADPLLDPGAALQQALVLGLDRNPGDVTRALTLIDPLLHSPKPELAPWLPLARLLRDRLVEQRRLDELSDRQAQQLREQQRRIDQLSSQLEALKAIERSLATRAAPGAAPASAAGNGRSP